MSVLRPDFGGDDPFVTKQELCRELRLSPSTVDRLIREGLPSETWGLRVRRFQVSVAKAWLRNRRAA